MMQEEEELEDLEQRRRPRSANLCTTTCCASLATVVQALRMEIAARSSSAPPLGRCSFISSWSTDLGCGIMIKSSALCEDHYFWPVSFEHIRAFTPVISALRASRVA